MTSYFIRHLQVFFATLGDMARSPAATVNTVLIIAISMLLPCLLYVFVKSSESLSETWQGRPQISVFLQKDVDDSAAQLIFQEIQLHPDIELAEFVSPEQALEEFRLLSNSATYEQELAFLGSNPLPPSIVLMPNKAAARSAPLEALKNQLSKIEGIETIRLDLAWTERFSAILAVITRAGILLSILLGLALVLIVGNTIKLLIHNRRDEIEISKLVGGTNSFVRRPFLYYGSALGFLGACTTLLLLLVTSGLIEDPLSTLASMYQQQSLLHKLTVQEAVFILLTGTLLGWLAARWSVALHLWRIRPQ